TVGCDGVLGSEKTLDQCGVCGGDNSTCRIVSGLFTRPNLRTGYNLIARIPRGACNINVTELKHSQNHLAIRTNSGEYVINGNWNINWSGTYNAAGTTFFYTRRNHITQQMENIVAKGPINQDVQILLVMYKTNNPGIRYEYMLPLKERSTLSPPNFRPISSASSSLPTSFPSWRTPGSFSMRGAHQGRDQSIMALEPGTYNKNRRPRTRNRQANREDSMTHPYLYQRTSTGLETPFGNTNSLNVRYDIGKKNADVFEWKVSGLTECSESCGGGKQSTLIVCRRRDNLVVVHDHYCNPLHKLKLQTFQCNTHPCPASWFPGDWGPCSTTCGDGTQTRDVTCKQRVSPRVIMKVTERACFDLEKPLSKQMCRVQTCVHWKTADWGECSTHCGKGMRKRQVRCVTQDSEAEVPESKCTDSKPDNEEMCDMGPCDNAWFFSPWTESCSAECGAGVQSRKVLCLQGTTNDSVKGTCDTSTRPKETRPCPSTKGCDGQWFTGSWSQCSETCGPGKKKREVICMTFTRGQWYSALDINCHKKKKPDTTEACNQKACGPEWYTTSWTECSRSCNTGVQSREVSCVSENQQISQECPVGTKPALRKACSTQECPGSNIASGCVDQFKNCDLVVQSRLCRYSYYRQICCNSCHGMR
ncbi:thrombospondin type-1 domain-containing protein 4-like, partial [Limulus polyphemus]|uniref:Thrombospondin type-1 domain-containing protein 4-like n=1 Tax=Limulus polyphemus TaxID=6850 RepID=A0ABM1BRJ5_LIMPO